MSALLQVPAPEEASKGFVAEFLEHSNKYQDCAAAPGDELDLDSVSVQNGKILTAVAEAATCTDAKYIYEIPLRIRVRARVKESADDVERPLGHLLVKGIWSLPDGTDHNPEEYLPVSAAVELRVSQREVIYVFFLYVTGEYGPSHSESVPADVAWINIYDDGISIMHSPDMSKIWDEWQSRVGDIEGVLCLDNACSSALREKLMCGVDQVIKGQKELDFHPNTESVVLDVVHPSLFPFVRGVSIVVGDEADLPRSRGDGEEFDKEDFWKRPYEASKFQWLPSLFKVSDNGEVSIASYINNLDMQRYGHLYESLEELFKQFLPLFEKAYGYVRAVKFHGFDEAQDLFGVPRVYEPDEISSSLRGRELKVITKIVEYRLRPNQEFDGVWHVEGMSHENILATGLYILEREDGFRGGDLLFKRAFLDYEASHIYENVSQRRHPSTDSVVADGIRPLGKLPTPKGRMIVFPNSHVHKLSKMFRDESCSDELVRRRIIVFWLVNPECHDIITTRGVLPQQATMPRDDALKYRLELMEERKRHKQDWNVREIELCEH